MARPRILVDTKELALPWDESLSRVVPGARASGDEILLPYTHEVVRLARNMGHTVPAPITRLYKWPGPEPFKTQRITAALLTMNRRAYVLSEMGTGKTRATLFAIDFLRQHKEVRKTLIVAPLSTLSQVWDREIFQFFPHMKTVVLHGSREKRRELLARDADIYIINHDGIQVIQKELMEADIDVVVLDEASVYRNQRTDRWKHASGLVSRAKYAWALTGSPTPNEPCDAWGLAKLLTPARVPKYFKQFKEDTMLQVSTFRWVPKKDALDKVHAALQPAVRFTREDCIELPEVSYIDHDIKPSANVTKVYEKLMRELTLAFREGQVSAANEGVLYNKLLQISSGWVYTTNRDVVELGNDERVDAVEYYYNATDHKLLVFCAFTHTAKLLTEALRKKGLDVALITGASSKAERDAVFTDFQTTPRIKAIIAHPACMSHGLTLTAANTVIWFTPITSLETYEQACARITRPGQRNKQMIVHLQGTPVEKRVYGRLRKRAAIQGALLEMFDDNV